MLMHMLMLMLMLMVMLVGESPKAKQSAPFGALIRDLSVGFFNNKMMAGLSLVGRGRITPRVVRAEAEVGDGEAADG